MKYLQIDSVIKPAFAAALSVLALAGCQKNGFDAVSDGDECIVKFVPSVAGTEDLTKGALINEEGPGAISFDASKSFFVTAWDNAATPNNIIPGTAGTYQEVKMKGTQWNTVYTKDGKEYSKEYLWKDGEIKTFFAYAYLPAGDVVASIIPGAGEDPAQELTHTVSSTSTAQADILMGFYKGDGKTGPAGSQKMTGTAGIVFSHPLTAVKFKQGKLPTGTSIKSIGIKGVYPSGKAEMNPITAVEEDSKDRFIWTNTDGNAFTKTDETLTVSLGSVTVASGTKQIGDAFLLIPQDFDADSESCIEVVLQDDNKAGTELNLYYPLNTNLGTESSPVYTSWSAGYTNTYTINFDGIIAADKPEMYNGSPLEDDRINGHEFVEIGGLKWATMNIGANIETDYGYYFFWGGTEGYVYDSANSKWVKASDHSAELSGGFDWKNTPFNNGAPAYDGTYFNSVRNTVCPDGNLAQDYDAAHVNWGGSWRMPTQADFQTLYEACGGTGTNVLPTALSSSNPGKGIYWVSADQEYIAEYTGVAGILLCDEASRMFFPAAGSAIYTSPYYSGTNGYYWLSTLNTSMPPYDGYHLRFNVSGVTSGSTSELRYKGFTVRPVSE